MSQDEVNERAWNQMRVMHDNEIITHQAAVTLLCNSATEPDIWDLRIAVRDYLFNELWKEVKAYDYTK